jgi:putative peptide zinc metalloprotease protein
MLLVFTPCLYCNVSDAWTFPNKWHRIAVSLAGIYAELVLAAICTLLWWFSEPGLLHWICLDVMLLCSVSTLLVNGNPLLKYDGYYALGDWLGVPNLRQQSGQSLEQFVSSWVCGADAYSPRTLPLRGRWFLALYGTGAAVYRCFVIGIILVTIHAVLKSYQLESVAKVLAVFVVGGVVAASTWSMARMIRRMSMRPVNRTRAMLLVGSGLALLTSVLLVPLPARVRCPAQLWPVNARDIYVSIPGTLADQVTPGARVEQGQTIAKLSSLNLQQEVHDLRGKLNLQRIHVQHLQLRRASDSAAGNELPAAQEMLADFEEQLVERQADLKRLTIASPIDGIVLPPRTVAKDAAGPDELSRWHGRPLEPHNEGAFIETGTLLCYVGDPRQLEALLVIDETARERVRLGQQVRIQVALFAGTSLTGTIVELARGDPMTADRDSLSRPPLPLSELAEANRLDSAAYYARVELDNSDSDLCGVTGAATVAATPRSLGRRAIDYLSYTFRFRL